MKDSIVWFQNQYYIKKHAKQFSLELQPSAQIITDQVI